jgi:hypothetical protein
MARLLCRLQNLVCKATAMDKESVKQWLDKRADQLAKDAEASVRAMYPERIHSFRTGTKKLRAVLRLLAGDKESRSRLPSAYRHLYRATGEVRDSQVLLQMVMDEKRKILQPFAAWLSYKIGAAANSLAHRHSSKALRELRHHVAGFDHEPEAETLDRFFCGHLQETDKLRKSATDDEAMHLMRKKAKDMQYVLAVCRKVWPEVYEKWAPLIKTQLKELSEKAGAYNDRRNLLDMLSAYCEKYNEEFSDEEREALRKVDAHWTSVKAAERRALLRAAGKLNGLEIVKICSAAK